jgi:glycosyltransferase involved in cell wall biosynthesis
MKILHLATDIYGGHGGIALYNRELIAALATHRDVEEIVVIPRVIRNELEPIPPKVRFLAAAVRSRATYMRTLLAAARATKFDLVICAHVNLLPIARLITKNPLLFIYGIEAWRRLRDPISNRLACGVRAVVSISDVTLQRFLGWSKYEGTTHLLPNSIRTEEYGIRERNLEMAKRFRLDGRRAILTLGRVVAAERYKGFDEVLEVLPEILKVHDDVTYVIAGGGNDLPRLAKKAVTFGVANRVIFTSYFPESEKTDLYNLADVYAMPSRGEGFGFVFLEAMACGVPVIASRLDGGREAVRHGALGRLIDPANPAEVKLALLDALAQREKRIPEGLEYFSFANFEERAHAILENSL